MPTCIQKSCKKHCCHPQHSICTRNEPVYQYCYIKPSKREQYCYIKPSKCEHQQNSLRKCKNTCNTVCEKAKCSKKPINMQVKLNLVCGPNNHNNNVACLCRKYVQMLNGTQAQEGMTPNKYMEQNFTKQSTEKPAQTDTENIKPHESYMEKITTTKDNINESKDDSEQINNNALQLTTIDTPTNRNKIDYEREYNNLLHLNKVYYKEEINNVHEELKEMKTSLQNIEMSLKQTENKCCQCGYKTCPDPSPDPVFTINTLHKFTPHYFNFNKKFPPPPSFLPPLHTSLFTSNSRFESSKQNLFEHPKFVNPAFNFLPNAQKNNSSSYYKQDSQKRNNLKSTNSGKCNDFTQLETSSSNKTVNSDYKCETLYSKNEEEK